jgi:hypothetical protein
VNCSAHKSANRIQPVLTAYCKLSADAYRSLDEAAVVLTRRRPSFLNGAGTGIVTGHAQSLAGQYAFRYFPNSLTLPVY